MKQGWETKTMGDVLDLMRNGVNCKQDKNGVGDKISRIESISSASFDINKVGFATLSQSDKEKYRLNKGDILFSHINSPIHVGKTALFNADEEVYHGVNLLLMRPKPLLNINYFEHYLKFLFQNGYWLKLCKQSVNQASVNQQDINKAEINFPISILEQRNIVAILDKVFASIARAKANTEQNLLNARELFENYLQSAFVNKIKGTKSDSLDTLCELIVDCEHKTAPIKEKGYPSIRTPNIGKGSLILEDVNRVSEETYSKWTKRAIPQAGDLILAREAPAGNVAVIPENLKVCLGQRTVLIRTKKDKLYPMYLTYLLLSKDVQEKLLSHSRGATVTHVNMKDIRAFKIYDLSPLSEQQTLVRKLDSLSAETKKLGTIYQQKLNDLEELKKSILQMAFNGELKTTRSVPI